MDDPTLKDIIRKIAQGKFILNSTCRNRIYRQPKIISIKNFDIINQHNPILQPGPRRVRGNFGMRFNCTYDGELTVNQLTAYR